MHNVEALQYMCSLSSLCQNHILQTCSSFALFCKPAALLHYSAHILQFFGLILHTYCSFFALFCTHIAALLHYSATILQLCCIILHAYCSSFAFFCTNIAAQLYYFAHILQLCCIILHRYCSLHWVRFYVILSMFNMKCVIFFFGDR